jgi:transcriptional regulator with XRE-family HTH domain
MSTYNAQIQEWTHPLRNMTIIGTSIATLVLIPLDVPVATIAAPQPVRARVEVVTTIPDGGIDLATLQYRTNQGLTTGVSPTHIKQDEEEFEANNLPKMLREISGLPVETLAELIGVSRNAYNKWLRSGGVKPEHLVQLTKLFDTFQTLRNLRIPDLRSFLENAGPSGKPLDLLASGDIHAVVGLALRSVSRHQVSSSVSEEARQVSGITGWVRPAKKLNWKTPRLEGDKRDDALDHLSPRPVPGEVIMVDDSDKDE